jgi:hypothetical protein
MPKSKLFTTRAVLAKDFTEDRYSGALSSSMLSPGEIADEVFGEEINFGTLFAYLFRRFGLPNSPSDDYKDIAQYLLTTPMKGLFLSVRIIPHNNTSLLFGYVMLDSLNRTLMDEYRVSIETWHQKFQAWAKTNKINPISRYQKTQEPTQEGFQEMEYSDGVKLYQEKEQASRKDDEGPKTLAVKAAMRVALEDLKRPVGVRDSSFTANGEDGEGKATAKRFEGAGYYILPDLVSNGERIMALNQAIIDLGDGKAELGIKRALRKSKKARKEAA